MHFKNRVNSNALFHLRPVNIRKYQETLCDSAPGIDTINPVNDPSYSGNFHCSMLAHINVRTAHNSAIQSDDTVFCRCAKITHRGFSYFQKYW